jgi:hypothetical protein
MSELVKNLNQIIDTGIKLYSVDEENQKIEIINGIEITDQKTDVLISSHKINFDEELKTFIKTDKFQNALFKPAYRGILLIDITGYSKGDTLYQAAVLTIFNQVIKLSIDALKQFSKGPIVEQIIPTGDGCYIVFNEGINEKFFRAILTINSEMNSIQNRILDKFLKDNKNYDKLHIRIGCTLHETDFFYDAAGNRNCYGVGMNEAARILSCGQKEAETRFPGASTIDSLFFDETIYSQAKPLIELLQRIVKKVELVELGEVADKHGIKRKIWWLKNIPKNLAFNLFSPGELKEK